MAIRTIGAAGDYTTIAAWSAAVKAIGSLTENEEGRLIDDAVYPITDSANELKFTSTLLNGFTITLKGFGSGVYNHLTGTGARIEFGAFNGKISSQYVNVEDVYIANTTSSPTACALAIIVIFNRCVFALPNATGGDRRLIQKQNGSVEINSCLFIGGDIGFEGRNNSTDADVTITNCTFVGQGVNAISALGTLTGDYAATITNNAIYDCTGAEFNAALGGFGFANVSYTASEDNLVGTNGVALVGSPFVDYAGGDYTPSTGGQLDGAGTNTVLPLNDITGAAFDDPPSIGAFEATAAGTPTVDDIDTDEIVTDGQQNATFTTSNFSSEITTVKLVSGTHETVCTGVTSTGGAGTFDIPDVSTFVAPTVGAPFTSASHAVVAELSNA